MKLKRMTTCAMLIAMNVVLCCATPIKLDNFKFTFEAFPILVAGLLYGPVEGLTVGFFGSFIYQVFFSGYGFTPTTLLWVIPHAASGLFTGLIAKKKKFELSSVQITVIAVASAVLVTTLNTAAMYLASKMEGWYTASYVFGTIVYRYITGIILAVIFALILPKLIERLKKIK